MADHALDHHHGDMDIHAQQASFHAFLVFTKWGCVALASGLLFLVIWFCTTGGFLAGAVAGAVVLALGIALLRERAPAH